MSPTGSRPPETVLEEAQQRSMRHVPGLDWSGRTADQLAPMVLRTMEE